MNESIQSRRLNLFKKVTVIFIFMVLLLLSAVPCAAVQGAHFETGPVYEWDQADWNAASSWTDEQWEYYICDLYEFLDDDEYGYNSERYDKFYSAMDTWTESQHDLFNAAETLYYDYFVDTDKYYDYINLRYKIENGFPYYDGINVKINKDFVTFSDARPVINEGRTMLPVRDIFEKIGASVDWNKDTKTAIAAFENGRTVLLTIGSKNMQITSAEGVTKTVEMDVVPYIDNKNGRILVPLRFVSEAAGYSVEWDDSYKVAELIDREGIIAEIDKKFTQYNEFLSCSAKASELTNPAITNSFDITGNLYAILYGDETHSTASAKGSISGLINGTDAKVDGTVKLDLDFVGDFVKAISSYSLSPDETDRILNIIKDINFNIIADSESKSIYVKSNLYKLDKPEWNSSAWQKYDDETIPQQIIDLYNLENALYTALADDDLIGDNYTIGCIIFAAAEADYGDTIDTAEKMSSLMELIIGDKYIKTSSSGSSKTCTVTHSKASLTAAGAIDLLINGELSYPYSRLSEEWESVSAFNYTYSFEIGNDNILGQNLSFDMGYDGIFPFTVSMKVVTDENNADFNAEFAGKYIGKISLDLNAVTNETTAQIPKEPPSGDKIVEFESIENNNDPYPTEESVNVSEPK